MKNLRKQLYSAADYFEKSYSEEDQKQLVMDTLKDYAVKALINTIDHLGSVAFKVNQLLDEKVGKASALELQFTCLEQRLQTCQEYISHGGFSQQFLVARTPKYHKRYIFPAEETIDINSKYHRRSFSADYSSYQFKNAIRARIKGTSPSVSRDGRPRLQSPQVAPKPGNFTFAPTSVNKKTDKRTSSPQRFQLIRSGTLLPKRSKSPSNTNDVRRYPSEPRRAVSLSTYPERGGGNEIDLYSSKSKRLFKALLSMRKPKKDHTFYKYLDNV
ncbi:protein ABIL2-like isoform X2 [Mercurialis annua]|nr:protein ABIL2-like isoform X2 [Mercurialis annua]